MDMSKEMVDHPKHYNNHPSGIEAIEIIRSMCFNIGNSFKYVYRRNDKDHVIQDLKKAIWYIEDEIKRRDKWGYTFFAKLFVPVFYLGRQDIYSEYKHRGELMGEICKSEQSHFCSSIYRLMHLADVEFWNTTHLRNIKARIESMISEEQFYLYGLYGGEV
jgi:hypothetical protein